MEDNEGGSGESNERYPWCNRKVSLVQSLLTLEQIMGKGRVQRCDPSLTEYHCPDIIENQEARGAKVFVLYFSYISKTNVDSTHAFPMSFA